MPSYADFQHEAFPIVTVYFTGEAANEQNFQAYLNELHLTYEQKKPFTYLFDATDAALPGLKYQKMQADWLKANEDLMKTYCQGTAYVIPNQWIRAVLKGIFALQQQPVPYYVARSVKEAREWCAEKVKNSAAPDSQ